MQAGLLYNFYNEDSMLPQSVTAPPASAAPRRLSELEAWAAIEAALEGGRILSATQIADRIGITVWAAEARLRTLRELGEVRRVEILDWAGRPKRAKGWMLGAEDEAAAAEQMIPVRVPAVQLGDARRDPLVAALFGPAHTRHHHAEQGVA